MGITSILALYNNRSNILIRSYKSSISVMFSNDIVTIKREPFYLLLALALRANGNVT